MVKEGYSPAYSAAVTASSSLIGPIIPPSITMIIYGVSAGASIGGLFMAGILPGILMGLSLMATAYVFAVRQKFPIRQEKLPVREVLRRTRDALVALMMPIIILGGIFGGIMTPTESAAIAVVYALIAGFALGELHMRDLFPVFLRSGMVTASVMLIVGAARIFSDLLAQEQIPQQLASIVLSLTDQPWLLLLLINVFLLLVGFVMDTSAAIIILVPVLLPIATSIGIDPITFGVIMCVNLIIGLATPPLGVCLFVAADIAKIRVESLILAIWPFLLVQVAGLLLITYVRDIPNALPKYFGYM
jgi:tripartite ATP-independent transporter DctM subunit